MPLKGAYARMNKTIDASERVPHVTARTSETRVRMGDGVEPQVCESYFDI